MGLVWSYFFFFETDSEDLIIKHSNQQAQVSVISEQASTSTSSSLQADSSSAEAEPTEFTIGDSLNAIVPVTLHKLSLPSTLTLTVDNTGASWVQVMINDAVTFEATIPAGSSQDIEIAEGTEEISIRVGYLPSTTIVFEEDLEIPNPDNSDIIQTQTFIFDIE